jgi:hypothetical protein
MLGIPLELLIGGNPEKVYFATRRSGELGVKMRALRRTYHMARMEAARFLARTQAIGQAADSLEADRPNYMDELEKLLADQEKQTELAMDAKEKARAAAEELARLSLGENYSGDTLERIMNCLTDRQLAFLVTVIETGEVPEDFFPRPATQPSGSTTSPSVASTGASS